MDIFDNKVKMLPIEIQKIIFSFYNCNIYSFDKDSVYFYFNPKIFIIDDILNINLFGWFGTNTPENYIPGTILHVDFHRPYPIILERNFTILSKEIYNSIKKFKFRKYIIQEKMIFGGTYGPVSKNYSMNGTRFYNFSNVSWYFSPINISDYFQEMNIENENINLAIKSLEEKIIETIIESIDEFSKKSKNIIRGPIIRIIDSSYYAFFSFCKPSCDNNKILEKNIFKKVLESY